MIAATTENTIQEFTSADGASRLILMGGTVDAAGQLHLDEPLAVRYPCSARVLVSLPADATASLDTPALLPMIFLNEIFPDLASPEEDIYTLEDGVPFYDTDDYDEDEDEG